ncbi:MAG: ROK family protein [Archaeoglobaceae archaeon]
MIVGIDVGGTNTDIVAYDGEFKYLETIETKELSERKLEELASVAEAVGIGIAAWIKGRRFVKSPNIASLPKVDFDRFVIENDANCFAYFAAKELGAKNLLGVTVGTGIGSGIIVEGELYRGNGLAGEIGHTFAANRRVCGCGKTGHLEAIFGGRYMDAKRLIESGRVYATLGFELFCRALAFAVMLLDPEVVALGGRIGGRLNGEIVEARLRKYVDEEFEFRLVCIRDDLAVAKGAALLASSRTRH